MVVATSGYFHIKYNRIVSSTSFPYSVLSAEALRDPISSNARLLHGLYIIDLNHAVSLIFDRSSQITDLASINFQARSISYQKAFPKV
jgi:hypothetical protein